MEKVLWVKSNVKGIGLKEDDGLGVVNKYLEDGWKVKFIKAFATDSMLAAQAYIVIEKED